MDNFLNIYTHWLWALGSAPYYRFPSRELIVIGATGTNGKSSVVEMAQGVTFLSIFASIEDIYGASGA